ncbi:MAG: histidine phosphatase family protein [Deltaproteobacteria bacterium]|nr:histidine phosphatase family protein [Deltaproteobacteria bacterium]
MPTPPTTTRRLIVLRHAKSERYADVPTDHDRPLNPRGRADAPAMAARLGQMGWQPEIVISSDAQRTRQTWAGMAASFAPTVTVEFTRALYHAGTQAVRTALTALPPTIQTAMVVGHNPGWEDVVYSLCGVRVRMTTCNAALLTVEAPSWSEAVTQTAWTLDSLLRPKEL